jgi:phosphotransferase system HPr (HPr) family protein
MMFGIPGAVLAIIKNARPERKKTVTGIMLSCAVCSFVCGVTEPFEFAFMFISPMLYIVYALMYGLITYITVISGFRAGFCFSGGVLDLVFSSSLPAAARTWLIIPLGLLSFVLFYIVFSFMIKKLNLKTPGREDDEVVASAEARSNISSTGNSYSDKAARLLEGIGGKGNIISLDNCITRLRLELKDTSVVDEKKLLSAGAAGVINTGKNTIQIVIGTTVQFVADEMHRLCESGGHKTITHYDSIFGDPDLNITGNSFEYVVNDPTGIHARPAGIIAGIARKYECSITVNANGKEAPADKVTDLMSLGVTQGMKLKVSAEGKDTVQALTELYQYMRKAL